MNRPMQEDLKIAEEAAEWLMRLSEDTSAACRNAFCLWFRQSPRHVQEFLDASETVRTLQGVDRNRQIDVESLLAAATTNVVALGHGDSPVVRTDPAIATGAARTVRRRWAVSSAAAAIVIVAVAFMLRLDGHSSISTTIGEQRIMKLDDGSVVTLNTRSRIEVQFAPHERNIHLHEGEALFSVAQDATRPFRVITNNATVRALGTQFDVHRTAHGTVVAVIEGSVQVSPVTNSARGTTGTRLSAGQEAQVSNQGRMSTRTLPDPAKAVTWRERRLEFHDVALAEVAAEFNRYNRLQMRVEGPIDAAKLISGIFNADDPHALLRFLQRDQSLILEQEGQTLVIRQRHAAPSTQ